MKIGEVSNLTNISINTIRYYIQLGLLNPVRRNNQYIFSEEDLNDILKIKSLKNMRFSLREIETVIRFGRTSNWIEPNILKEYSTMLKEKKAELEGEQEALQGSIDLISAELQNVARNHNFKVTDTGVPLRALPLLTCPKCGKPMQIEQAFFSHKYVMDGVLTCDCGYGAKIDRGILKTGNRYTGAHDSPDLERNLYQTLCNDLLKMYQQCGAYILQKLQGLDLNDKVVIESCVNGYFFLYNHFPLLSRNCLYIIVDKYPEMLLMYKHLIEGLGLDLDILYIADNGAELPIAPRCVDVCVDFFNSNEWSFYHVEQYNLAMSGFFAPECHIIGCFMDINTFSKTKRNFLHKYPEGAGDMFCFQNTCDALKGQLFQIQTNLCGSVKRTQNSFSFACHTDDEELRFFLYHAQRHLKA